MKYLRCTNNKGFTPLQILQRRFSFTRVFFGNSKDIDRQVSVEFTAGFTVIEMITVIAIFSIMMGVAMANFDLFKSNTEFALSAQEVALIIKEQQQNAMAGKLPDLDPTVKTYPSANWKPAYGVYFDTAPANNQKMFVFYDNDVSTAIPIPMYGQTVAPGDPGPEYYEYVFGVNDGSATIPSACVDQATPNYECMKEINFEKMKLKTICRGEYSSSLPGDGCPTGSIPQFSATFRRPYPDAHMRSYIYGPLVVQPEAPVALSEIISLVFETIDVPGSCNIVTINPIGAVSVHQDKC